MRIQFECRYPYDHPSTAPALARALEYAFTKLQGTPGASFHSLQLTTGGAITITFDTRENVNPDMWQSIADQISAVLESACSRCPCGCGVDLAISDCIRDTFAGKPLQVLPGELDIAYRKNITSAALSVSKRTGYPVAECADAIRQAIKENNEKDKTIQTLRERVRALTILCGE